VIVSEPQPRGYGGSDAVVQDGCGNLHNLHQGCRRTMWLLMIVLHAAAALGAFAVGVTAIDPRRATRHRWTPPALVALLVAMTVFTIGAMAAHRSDLPGASQIAFSALIGLAVYMVHRRQARLRPRRPR
jgi:hypothetical protein